jgi:peptidyl-prolyl cis-trans isomerase D
MYRFFKRNREAVKKYLLIFFLSIVSIGMVITLAPIPSGDTIRADSNVLASLGRVNVTTQDLQQTIHTRFQNSPLGNDSHLVPLVANSVLDEMVLRLALMNQAAKMGIEVSDPELRQSLETIPWLYPNGTFVGMDQYRNVIYQQTGMSVPQFEGQLRESLVQEKLRSVVTDGVQIAPQEVLQEFRRRDAKAKIAYVLFDPSQFLKAVAVTSQGLEAYFQRDPSRYKIPEQRKVRYVLIDADEVRSQVKISDPELRQYYAQHLSDYRVPDRVKVARILFKTTEKTPAEVATLEKTAREVLAQVKAGADFGDLAKKYSEDTSASSGGEIGWIVRGQTVKEFEDAAFSMRPGQVSDLIKTVYSIEILKVLDKQTAHLQAFDEVKDSIRAELERQRLADLQEKLSNDLVRQLQGNPEQLDALARKAGLEPKESPLFRYGAPVPDLGNGDAFENLAFQLRQGEVGSPVSVPKGQAIIQVVEISPEHIPPLEEVRARVEEDYRAEQSKVLAADKARQFAQQAKAGNFDKAAKAMGLSVKESNDFSEQDNVEGVGSGSQLSAAFKLEPGQSSEVVALGGNSLVFRVVSHTAANEADFPEQRDRIAEELLDQKRSLTFELYRRNLKQQLLRSGNLKINAEALKAFIALYQKP